MADVATRFNADEQSEINRIGVQFGCHSCGTKEPGTRSGNFVVDVQPPTNLVPLDRPQRLYPHCLACSRSQGGHVLAHSRHRGWRSATLTIRPPNSIVFIRGRRDCDVPSQVIGTDEALVWATADCVVVGTHAETDGPTRLVIGHPAEIAPDFAPAFVGIIETSERRIVIEQVDGEVLYDEPVPHVSARVSVWFSHPRWPEQVFVGFD